MSKKQVKVIIIDVFIMLLGLSVYYLVFIEPQRQALNSATQQMQDNLSKIGWRVTLTY